MLSENVRELKMWLQEEKVSEITPTEDSEQSEVDYSQGESLKAWVSEARGSLSLGVEKAERVCTAAVLRGCFLQSSPVYTVVWGIEYTPETIIKITQNRLKTVKFRERRARIF